MGKLTISMAMFNSYVKLPEGIAIMGQANIADMGMHMTFYIWVCNILCNDIYEYDLVW